jgi:two-component system sensor histidine kinase UhpB
MAPRKRVPSGPTLAKRVPEVTSEELGKFLARELHDTVAQTLASMLLELENFRIEQHGRVGALRQIDLLEQSTRKALADLRALLVELRLQRRHEEDLISLIRRGMLERKGRGTSVEFELQVAREWPERMSTKTATELHLIVSEAVDNAVHHGNAKKVQVALCLDPGTDLAVITITDDGTGMGTPHGGQRPGFGIVGMRERAGLLGGQVSLEAAPTGKGTRVQVTVPAPVLGALEPGA